MWLGSRRSASLVKTAARALVVVWITFLLKPSSRFQHRYPRACAVSATTDGPGLARLGFTFPWTSRKPSRHTPFLRITAPCLCVFHRTWIVSLARFFSNIPQKCQIPQHKTRGSTRMTPYLKLMLKRNHGCHDLCKKVQR